MRPRPGFEGGPPNFLAGLGRIPPHFYGFEIGASPPPPVIDLRVPVLSAGTRRAAGGVDGWCAVTFLIPDTRPAR